MSKKGPFSKIRHVSDKELHDSLEDHTIWLRRLRSSGIWLYRRVCLYFFWQAALTGAVLYILLYR